MQKLTLTYIDRKQRYSKDNKPYTSMSIQASEYGQTFLTGFGNDANAGWKVGDVVEIEDITQKPNPKGGTYWNFIMPKSARGSARPSVQSMGGAEALLEKISNQLALLITHFMGTKDIPPDRGRQTPPAKGYHYPTPEEEGIDTQIEDNFDRA